MILSLFYYPGFMYYSFPVLHLLLSSFIFESANAIHAFVVTLSLFKGPIL